MEIKTPFIWKNGEFIDWDKCNEHHVNHSLHYGSGVFEGIRFYETKAGPKIFRLEKHIKRLFYSAKVMNMEIDYNENDIINACIETVNKSGEKAGYIRPIIYHESGIMGLSANNKINTTISVWAWGKYLSDNPIDIKISSVRRMSPETADMKAKVCGYYSNNIQAIIDIKKEGYDEGLLLDCDGNIAEGPGENIFFVKGDEVYTPELGAILPGITRDTIIKLLDDKFGIKVIEKKILPNELGDFDEAFFVGTAAEVTLIGSITNEDGKKYELKNDFSPTIKKLYELVVTGEKDEYSKWLS